MGNPQVVMLADGNLLVGMQSLVEKEKKRRAEGEESGTPLYLRRAAVAGGDQLRR